MPTTNTFPVFNPKDYGAVGDGTTDATTAFQNCLADAGSSGSVKFVLPPPGNYKFSSGNLHLPANVTLQGSYNTPPNHGKGDGTITTTVDGTYFSITYNSGSDPFL